MRRAIGGIILALFLLCCGCSSQDAVSTPPPLTADIQNEVEQGDSAISTITAVEPTRLTLAVPTSEMAGNIYTDAIAAFNDSNGQYYIELKDYGEDDSALRMELLSGTGPDMIMAGAFGDEELLTGKGYLTDLYAYMDIDPDVDRESFTNLNLLELEGKLTYVSPCYQIETYFGSKETYGEQFHWTPDEFLEKLDQAASPQEITGNLTSMNFLRIMLPAYTKEYVSYTDVSCNF